MILVTEAYSTSNLGDKELVIRSIQYAETLCQEGDEIRLLAVDPDSFEGHLSDSVLRSSRIVSRLSYLRAGRLGRFHFAVVTICKLLLASLLALIPVMGLRRGLARTLFAGTAIGLYGRATRVIAVGGGYLGSQYAKESLITGWTWWFATRLGVAVETMPISAEFRRDRIGRVWGRMVRGVRIRTRDKESHASLKVLGVDSEFVPDLAFLGAIPASGSQYAVVPGRLAVALVGSDYLSNEQRDDLVGAVVAGCSVSQVVEVALVSMHAPIEGSDLGGDVSATDCLAARLNGVGIRSYGVSFSDYEELIAFMSTCQAVLSARMHAGIAGLCSDRPVGFLAYERKHYALCEDIGFPERVVGINSGLIDIKSLVARVLSERDSGGVAHLRAQEIRYRLNLP